MTTLAWMAIPLTQGLYALVDSEDFERLNKHKWFAQKGRYTYYAERTVGKQPNRRAVSMHRVILGLLEGMQTDHRNGCGLDNRRSNLRKCTHAENMHNQRLQTRCKSSKYKGVSWNKGVKKWLAQIGFDGKVIHLGQFDLETEAAIAYDTKAKDLFGEFAKTNF